MITEHVAALTVAAVLLAALGTVAVGAYGGRGSRSTSDFLVASRSIGAGWNAAAIAGEYLSAASFLGVAGLVAKYGADALWYPIGFTAGYLSLLLFVAAPLRRSGAYTVPDFAEFRLASTRARKAAMVVVIVICVLYLVPQLQGAGLTLNILLHVPPWVGVTATGLLVIVNVVGAGMRSVTFAQAIQYWLKLTAVAIPALVLAAVFLNSPQRLGDPLPPRVSADTTVRVDTPVEVTVTDPAGVRATGDVDRAAVVDQPLSAGTHRLDRGAVIDLAEGAATPVVANAPQTGSAWMESGGGLGGGHPLYQVLSLIVATFLGAMGLPHVLVRFYTNPDGRAARRTALNVIAALAVFYLFPTVLGALARAWVPQVLATGTADAAVLLLPASALHGAWAIGLSALVAAGAMAAFLATSSGLLVSIAGVMSTDLMPPGVRSFRICALLGGAVPIVIALNAGTLELSRSVGLVFAVSASTLCPLLVLGIWWRGLTAAGAIAGLCVGATTSALAVGVAVTGAIDEGAGAGWLSVIAGFPAAVTVPLTFATMVLVSLATRSRIPAVTGAAFARMHVPERLGLGVERTPSAQD
ncbi:MULTISPECIES: sodium/solute symporter [Gordonia]|uniref:Putative SSS family transporter n=1 Tax=Gordonia sihwensis NBRC 108236 TaxID=1223544 RepID=L7LN79_9ACTN|nr:MULTISPECIES: cation acetate symporter [Gordonia]AUH67172.1 cation acetate symporter [Gordonia sp. YC-JH1]GAC61552.1 putative SSS family transporter [Gordonia sihwensis NBRC 108236]